MGETRAALQRVVAQISTDTDVLIAGTPGQARQVMAEAAMVLRNRATVVSIASPIGELSLTAVIAQLSGRPDLDDHDDAALELGLKQLNGEGRTVLMLLAPAGISRLALRFLQHVACQSPRLAMVVYCAPSLGPMLKEPAFTRLRARLHAAPAVGFEAVAVMVPVRSVAVVLPSAFIPPQVAPPQKRQPVVWAACAFSLAAIAGLVWLGSRAPGTAVAFAGVPLVGAIVPAPALIGLRDPVAGRVLPPIVAAAVAPPLVSPAMSTMARLPVVALATLPPAPTPQPHADPLVAGLGQPDRPPQTRREPPRYARTRSYAPRYQEPAEGEPARPWDGVSPVWVRRDPRRRDAPYLGTYAVDSNGIRVFQYDP